MTISFPLPGLRRLGAAWPARAPRYTVDEVQALLDPATAGAVDRRAAVLAVAAVPSSWTEYVADDDTWVLGRQITDRLPTILFQYRSGRTPEEIGRGLGVLGGAWRAERALAVAARCIADRLNDRGTPAAQGAV